MKLETTGPTRSILAAVFAFLVVGALSLPTARGEPLPGGEGQPAASGGAERQIVVYYFHGERRCKTCLTIEAYAKETVDTRFAKQLSSGDLVWEVVNYDGEGNGHFVEEFALVSASLVIVETNDGEMVRFEVLQKAWSLVRDKTGFQRYVRDSILGYLG
jgi:hypothetical protein